MKAATGVTAFELIIKIALGLVEYNEISENLVFRDSCLVLLPKAVYKYSELGRIRGKYPKITYPYPFW